MKKNRFFTIHEKNLQYLASEAFKVKVGQPSIIMKEIFQYTEDPDYKPIGNHLWKQILVLHV